MSDWPTVAAVKRRLGITSLSSEVEADAQSALDAAVEQVKLDTGGPDYWEPEAPDPEPEPTASLSEAALLLAVSTYKGPDAPYGVAAVFDVGGIYVARSNPNYERLLVGARQSWGIG